MASAELDVLGAGGHASVIVNVALRSGVTRVTVWYDSEPDARRFPPGTHFAAASALPPTTAVVLGMGDLAARREVRARFPKIGGSLADPSAVIGYGVALGAGVVVMPGVVINPNADIGVDVILNSSCVIEHDCSVGRNSHISPGVRLGGGVSVGEHALIGTGAVVLPGVSVGDRAVVGAGAVVIEDVAAETTVVGIPARPLQR